MSTDDDREVKTIDEEEEEEEEEEFQPIITAGLTSKLSKLVCSLKIEAESLDEISYNNLSRAHVGFAHGEGSVSKPLALCRARQNLDETLNVLNALRSAESLLERMNANCSSRLKQLKNAHCLASLPNEILSQIFSFATHASYPASNGPRALTSLCLSHVCRSFRHNVINDPALWTDIMTAKTPFVDMCIQRSKGLPLDVSVNIYRVQVQPHQQAQLPAPGHARILYCDNSLPSLLDHADRWKTLRFIEHRLAFGKPELHKAFEGKKSITFPILERISGFDPSFLCFCYWDAPLLRSLATVDCVPPNTFSPLASLTSLDVGLTKLSLVYKMLGLLPSLKSVENFILDLSGLRLPVMSQLAFDTEDRQKDVIYFRKISCIRKAVQCDSVKNFTFCFTTRHYTSDCINEYRCLEMVLTKLRFENATSVVVRGMGSKVNVNSTSVASDSPNVVLFMLRNLLSYLFVGVPNVVDCDIIIQDVTGLPLTTPLPQKFPKGLKHLRFLCDTRIAFSLDDSRLPMDCANLSTLVMGLKTTKPGQMDHASEVTAMEWVRWLIGGCRTFKNFPAGRPAVLKKFTLLAANKVNGVDNYEYLGVLPSPSSIKKACKRVVYY